MIAILGAILDMEIDEDLEDERRRNFERRPLFSDKGEVDIGCRKGWRGNKFSPIYSLQLFSTFLFT